METIAGGSSELTLRFEAVLGGGRASEKHITDTGDRSSAHVVLSDDDILIEILLRLPVISLILFKSVSKRWLSIITDPSFTLHRSQIPNIDPPSGLFIQQPTVLTHIPSFGYDFVSLDTRIRRYRSLINTTSFGPDAGNVEILQSCNGLLLCCIRHDRFYVYNPSTDLCKMLPQLHHTNVIGRCMKMAFDPTESPHYKVVYAGEIRGDIDACIQIQTYSSETGNWRVCDDRFSLRSFRGFCHGIYWNVAIHWLDVDDGFHFKLDIEHTLLESLTLPGISDGKMHHDYWLFESRGCLLLVDSDSTCTHFLQLTIYEMRDEWSVKYFVNLDKIMVQFPDHRRRAAERYYFVVQCIVVGEREKDSYLVMEESGNLVKCNIYNKHLRRISHNTGTTDSPFYQPEKYGSFQFIASFAGVRFCFHFQE